MGSEHSFQFAIDKINEIGIYKANQNQKPYRLLHKLSKSLGVYMHGSQAFIGKHFNIPANKMNSMAKSALQQYCLSGVLQVPDQFKYNENRIYRHDRDGSANRNLWKESNKASADKKRSEPVKYHLNTVSK